MRALILLLCLCGMLWGTDPASCPAAGSVDDFQKKYLMVTPPGGWTREVIDDDLFNTCVAYDKRGSDVSVLACPGSDEDGSFEDMLADARSDGGSYVGSVFVQGGDREAILYVPTAGDEGVILVLMRDEDEEDGDDGEEASEEATESIFRLCRPMLERFRAFRLPDALYRR